MVDKDFSKRLRFLANRVCMAYNGKSNILLNREMVLLFSETEGYKCPKILSITYEDSLIIGLGYMCIAARFDNGNVVINEIAAENALYCFAKSYLEGNNTEALPLIFSLFMNYADLLDDTIERVLKDTFYYGCDYYKYNIDGYAFYKFSIMWICQQDFPTNIKNGLFIPSKDCIKSFIKDFNQTNISKLDNINEVGKKSMYNIYQSIINFLTDF